MVGLASLVQDISKLSLSEKFQFCNTIVTLITHIHYLIWTEATYYNIYTCAGNGYQTAVNSPPLTATPTHEVYPTALENENNGIIPLSQIIEFLRCLFNQKTLLVYSRTDVIGHMEI